MSLPDRPFRSLRALAALALLSLPLAGCIRPLNSAPALGGGVVADSLATIEVEPLPERLGHFLVQELQYNLNGSGQAPSNPVYSLAVTAKERVQPTVVNTSTGRADAASVIVDATFVLKKLSTGAVILTGTATEFASYERNNQRFASVRAARDAEIRIARNLAEQLRTRIAAKFASGV